MRMADSTFAMQSSRKSENQMMNIQTSTASRGESFADITARKLMKAAVLGFGNVAAATIEHFMRNEDLIRSKVRTPIEFVHVATRSPARAQGRVPQGCRVSNDCWALVNDVDVDVVLELTGDVALARQLLLQALANRKHVITANKALLAQHGEEILRRAEEVERSVLFEGAVAVSIPIIKTLRESAAANRISSITGVLNGTSNYVLWQMSEHGVDFATAIADAQRKGYAEANPTLDVSGEDAAHKLTLLASLGFGVPINFGAVEFKGIEAIDQRDIQFAQRLGYRIKLIAQARMASSGLFVSVRPTLVPIASMLAQVGEAMNGITLQGDLQGTAFLYGSGAGGRQTASAVLADLIELANRGGSANTGGAFNMGFRRSHVATRNVHYSREHVAAFYIRLTLDDQAGMLAKVSQVLADTDVSVNVLLQDVGHGGQTDLIAITHKTTSRQLRNMLPKLQEAAGPGHSVVIHPVLGEVD
jgi:homoserine dehydrogenase